MLASHNRNMNLSHMLSRIELLIFEEQMEISVLNENLALYQNEICTIGIVCIVQTLCAIFLGLKKQVVFYSDCNDLGLSAAVFLLPGLILIISTLMNSHLTIIYAIAGIVFLTIFLTIIQKTYLANNRSFFKTAFLIIPKLALSFLYALHLESSFNAKKAADRRKSRFFIVILAPLMCALVNNNAGAFRLSGNGRPKIKQ